jgi:hypothetical protein
MTGRGRQLRRVATSDPSPCKDALVLHEELADSRRLAGDLDAASAAWRQAVEIFEDLGNAEAHQVAVKLRDLAAAVGP